MNEATKYAPARLPPVSTGIPPTRLGPPARDPTDANKLVPGGWFRHGVKPPRPKGMPVMFKSTSTSLILRGVLAIITGAVALAWPGVTILALVILFAVYAFIGAGLQPMRAFSSATAGPVFGHLLLGLIDLAACL